MSILYKFKNTYTAVLKVAKSAFTPASAMPEFVSYSCPFLCSGRFNAPLTDCNCFVHNV